MFYEKISALDSGISGLVSKKAALPLVIPGSFSHDSLILV